jgi:hypothetical protein
MVSLTAHLEGLPNSFSGSTVLWLGIRKLTQGDWLEGWPDPEISNLLHRSTRFIGDQRRYRAAA